MWNACPHSSTVTAFSASAVSPRCGCCCCFAPLPSPTALVLLLGRCRLNVAKAVELDDGDGDGGCRRGLMAVAGLRKYVLLRLLPSGRSQAGHMPFCATATATRNTAARATAALLSGEPQSCCCCWRVCCCCCCCSVRANAGAIVSVTNSCDQPTPAHKAIKSGSRATAVNSDRK